MKTHAFKTLLSARVEFGGTVSLVRENVSGKLGVMVNGQGKFIPSLLGGGMILAYARFKESVAKLASAKGQASFEPNFTDACGGQHPAEFEYVGPVRY